MAVKSNAPLLSFGCEDILDEFESSYGLGFKYFQTYPNQVDVLNNNPLKEIIVEIFCHRMKVMSDSQTMTHVLYQVEPYLTLEDNDEHTERKISMKTKFVPFSPFEDDEEEFPLDDEVDD